MRASRLAHRWSHTRRIRSGGVADGQVGKGGEGASVGARNGPVPIARGVRDASPIPEVDAVRDGSAMPATTLALRPRRLASLSLAAILGLALVGPSGAAAATAPAVDPAVISTTERAMVAALNADR